MMMLAMVAVCTLVLLIPGAGGGKAVADEAADADNAADDSATAGKEPQVITMMSTGDLHLGSWAEKSSRPNEPGYLFGVIQPLLDKADVLTGNLECPLSTKGEVYVPKEYTLRANPRMVAELVAAGYDYVSLANNHMMDYGPLALQETLKVLKDNGIAYSGAGMNLEEARRCAYLTIKDVRFAFLSFSNTYPTEFYAGKSRAGTAPDIRITLRRMLRAAASRRIL